MGSFIFLSLITVIGFTLASLDLYGKDWQFWVISGCMAGSYISGGI